MWTRVVSCARYAFGGVAQHEARRPSPAQLRKLMSKGGRSGGEERTPVLRRVVKIALPREEKTAETADSLLLTTLADGRSHFGRIWKCKDKARQVCGLRLGRFKL